MAFAQQFSGINTNLYFLKEVVGANANSLLMVVHVYNFIVSVLNVYLVYMFRRKPMNLIGNGLVVLGLVIIGYSYLSTGLETKVIHIFGMVFYFAGFQICFFDFLNI